MTPLEDFLEKAAIDYRKTINKIQGKTELAKEKLFAIDVASFHGHKVNITIELVHICKYLLLFRNESIILKLKECGLTDKELQWFVSLNDIDKEFEKISFQNIVSVKGGVLELIETHLRLNFSKALLSWAMGEVKRDGVSMTRLTKQLIDLKNRRNYGNGEPKSYNDWVDVLLMAEIKGLEEHTQGSEFMIDFDEFIEMTKGKTEKKYLKYAVEQYFKYDKNAMSEMQFLGHVYGLFQLVLKEYDLPKDEDEFFEIKDNTELYFAVYKSKILKKILKLNFNKR